MSVLKKTEADEENGHKAGDKQLLTVKNILEFADKVKIEDVEEILNRQIECNMAICREGLEHPYGAEVGRILIDGNEKPTVGLKARAFAAAGSDARMNGCPMPVVINSGSGNQGVTVSVPVIVYREGENNRKEKTFAWTCSFESDRSSSEKIYRKSVCILWRCECRMRSSLWYLLHAWISI